MLVDGVERSFFQLDPNEVESITVLKDASATAVFGVRGANGVILVTTKRGVQGKAKVNFSTTFAWQMPSRVPEFANSYEYATAYNNAQLHDGVSEDQLAFSSDIVEKFRTNSDPLVYPSTSWTDMLIKNSALQTQHNFNISGGSERVKYFASLGVFTQDGLFNTFEENGNDKGFKYNRYNYRINMDIDVTKTTSMQVNLGGYLNDKQEPNYNNGTYTDLKFLFRDIYTAVPFAGAGVVDGKWVVSDQDLFSVGNYADGLNVYYGKGYNNRTQNTLNFDFKLEQKLDFLTKGLQAHIKGAYNSGVTITKRREGRANKYEAIYNTSGELIYKKTQDYQKLGYTESTGQSRNWYLEAAVNYKRDFGNHHVSALAMYNQSMTYYPFEGSSPSEFIGIPRSYVGLVGRATYDYKTKYLLDASVGYNGSENFAKGHRFGFFPSVSVGWNISQEKFWEPIRNIVSNFKIRGSYGLVGNDQVPYTRFLYMGITTLNDSPSYQTGYGSHKESHNGPTFSRFENEDMTWEVGHKLNVGADIQLFNSLNLTVDAFREIRSNILTTKGSIPNYLGAAKTVIYGNFAKVKNWGVVNRSIEIYQFSLKERLRLPEIV